MGDRHIDLVMAATVDVVLTVLVLAAVVPQSRVSECALEEVYEKSLRYALCRGCHLVSCARP